MQNMSKQSTIETSLLLSRRKGKGMKWRQSSLSFYGQALLCVFALFVSTLWISPASATPISVFSTGVDGSGNLLSVGASDPHYTLGPNPAGSGPFASTLAGGWVANTSTSQWINPTGNGSDFFPVGPYGYNQTFDLTGFNPSTAVITGTWSPDDGGQIFLNGAFTGNVVPALGFLAYNPFIISSGFASGVNLLQFRVFNQQFQTGLQVNITSATAAAVPESSNLILLASVLAGILGYGWRRKRAA